MRASGRTTRISASGIEDRVRDLQQGNNSGFREEFYSLYHEEDKHELLFTEDEAQKYCNRNKNRFTNILPFDHSRVVLKSPWVHDYINANHIRVQSDGDLFVESSKYFIAAQGPVSESVSDFWFMIWQENSRVIVSTFGQKKRECAHYWAEEGQTVKLEGGLSLTCQKETVRTDYVLREFSLLKNGELARNIYQYHYNVWPDHGIPDNPGTVLNFLWEVDQRQRQQNEQKAETIEAVGPIVVHCSGGIGRTGTFIVIDFIVDEIRRSGLNSPIDVPRTLRMVRRQRGGMVETVDQYRFVYLAVAHFVDTIRQRFHAYQKCIETGMEYTNIGPNPGSVTLLNWSPAANSNSTAPQLAKPKLKIEPLMP